MDDLTLMGSDGLVHRVYVAIKKRQFQSDKWLLCTRENLYRLVPDGTGKVVTCLQCLTTELPERRWDETY